MFRPRPEVPRHPHEGLQGERAGAVADAVHTGLVSGGGDAQHALLQFARIHQPQPRVRRLVLVRLEELRPAAPQRSIGEQLDRAHREQSLRGLLAPLAHRFVEAFALAVDHRVHAQRKLIALRHSAVGSQGLRTGSRVMHRGDSRGGQCVQRAQDRLFRFRDRRFGNGPPHQVHRGVHQNSGRFSLQRAEDAPAGRIRSSWADACFDERPIVAPERVDVGAIECHRLPRGDGGEQRRAGEAPIRPEILVPAAAADPLPGGNEGSVARHAVDALLFRARAIEAHLLQPLAVQARVAMRVDQAGDRAPFAQLDELHVVGGIRLALVARPHPDELSVAHQHRPGARPGGVEGVQGSDDQQLGHRV